MSSGGVRLLVKPIVPNPHCGASGSNDERDILSRMLARDARRPKVPFGERRTGMGRKPPNRFRNFRFSGAVTHPNSFSISASRFESDFVVFYPLSPCMRQKSKKESTVANTSGYEYGFDLHELRVLAGESFWQFFGSVVLREHS